MLSSQKSNLMKYLETFAVSETPEVVPENNIDAMFSLRLHVNLPNTFEVVARSILTVKETPSTLCVTSGLSPQ